MAAFSQPTCYCQVYCPFHTCPTQLLLQATAAFLPKDVSAAEKPLAVRVLLIMPTLYRRWAALRLADVEEWHETWAHQAMMAGTWDKGCR